MGDGYSVWGEHLPRLDGTAETAELWIREVAQFHPSHFPRRMLAVEPLLSVHGQQVLADQITLGTLGESLTGRVLVAEGLLMNPKLDPVVGMRVIRWVMADVPVSARGRSYRAAVRNAAHVYTTHEDWFTPTDASTLLVTLASA